MTLERTGIEKKFNDLCLSIVEEQGYKLYDLEYIAGQKILRLYIMNPETMTATIDDCVLIDRALTEPFEENSWIPEDVVLEVSSPGVFRKLRFRKQFEQNIGSRILIKYRGRLDLEDSSKLKGLKGKVLIGHLKGIQGDEDFSIELEMPFKDKNIDINIKSEQIVKANVEPEL